ncbi:hypothetical protein GGI07_003710 [Coemansia sp. Benny D115]|nr:hypothetical protein GGI07_003710 [Coemansia sp. Benny D115]
MILRMACTGSRIGAAAATAAGSGSAAPKLPYSMRAHSTSAGLRGEASTSHRVVASSGSSKISVNEHSHVKEVDEQMFKYSEHEEQMMSDAAEGAAGPGSQSQSQSRSGSGSGSGSAEAQAQAKQRRIPDTEEDAVSSESASARVVPAASQKYQSVRVLHSTSE